VKGILIEQSDSTFADWKDKEAQLLPWKHPFHPFYVNKLHILDSLDEYIQRGELIMFIHMCQQVKNKDYNLLHEKSTKFYLRRLLSLTRLHINEVHLNSIPSLLSFYSYGIPEIEVVQVWEMGMDLGKVIGMTEHLDDDTK
jgi:hypothetical protein